MKFSIKDFFSKCDQIRSFLQIWSHLLKKSLMKNFIFCAVIVESSEFYNCHLTFNLFSNNASFLYTLKTSESLKFSDVFRRCRSKILVENEGVDYFRKKTLSQIFGWVLNTSLNGLIQFSIKGANTIFTKYSIIVFQPTGMCMELRSKKHNI